MIVKLGEKDVFKIILVNEDEAKDIKYKLKGKFKGKNGEKLVTSEDMAYFGISDMQDEKLSFRELGFYISSFIKNYNLDEVHIDISKLENDNLYNFFLGLELAFYEKKTYKSEEKEKEVKEATIYISTDKKIEADFLDLVVKEAKVLAKNIARAIDFSDAPSNLLYPLEFAKQISELVKSSNISYKLLKQKDLEKMGLNLILSVGSSSEKEPCMVILSYEGDKKSKESLAIVGKGVCMDTGGYCLKPSASIYDMKADMAGASASICAIKAIADMGLKINVKTIVPLVENKISGSAYVPSDIIKSYSGKTVEIMNTDAEGRLILADAVSYAVKDEKATKVVDIATLTGSVVLALGRTITGLVTNSNEFYNIFEKSSLLYGERHLKLPYYKEHKDMLKSKFADLKHLGERNCGAITAGLFIQEFSEETPFIHLDIAGTGSIEKATFAYEKEGATGAGVIQLYKLAKELSN